MAISFTAVQMQECEEIATEEWYAELRAFLHREFPEVDAKLLADWCQLYRATCARLEITSGHAIYAFHILCLRAGGLISQEKGYIDQHVAYLHKYGSANALPIDLLAWVRACGA